MKKAGYCDHCGHAVLMSESYCREYSPILGVDGRRAPVLFHEACRQAKNSLMGIFRSWLAGLFAGLE